MNITLKFVSIAAADFGWRMSTLRFQWAAAFAIGVSNRPPAFPQKTTIWDSPGASFTHVSGASVPPPLRGKVKLLGGQDA